MKMNVEGHCMFEVKLNAPLNVEWEITNLCNLRCRHCYVGAGEKISKELTTKEALDLIAELDRIGVLDITISGGEPFLRRDIWQIIQEIKKREIPFIIYTNGTLLNKQRIQRLVETDVDSISISLNGAKPETHNFVQAANTFERVLRTIISGEITLVLMLEMNFIIIFHILIIIYGVMKFL